MPEHAQNLGEDRASFMRRIRAALGEDAGPHDTAPTPPAVDPDLVRLATRDDDVVALFCDRAKVVGMKVHRVRRDLAMGTLVAVLRELDARRLVLATGPAWRQLGLPENLAGAGFELVDWSADPTLDVQYDVDAGITDVHAALAETGTLVCSSGAGASRGPSLVPPAHVALVRASDIVPDLLDFYARLRGLPPSELPSSIAFITGPSKTADIEGVLITGVHGPGHVHILVIEDA